MTNEELAVKIQSGEREYIAALWEQNTGLFHLKAFALFDRYRKRCASCGVALDDVVQVCYFALCDAVQAFKPDRGYTFTSYIKYPLLNHFRALVGLRGRRDPLDQCDSLNEAIGDNGTTRLDVLEDPAAGVFFEHVDDDVFHSQLHAALENALSKLPENRAAVIRGRYFEGKTQGRLAAEMGVAHQRVHSLEFEALRTMRRDRALQAFHDEILSNMAYKGTGLTAFRKTRVSSVERAVIRAEELTDQRRG